jgi:hypothetical protein
VNGTLDMSFVDFMQSKRKLEIDPESQKMPKVQENEDIDQLLKSLEEDYLQDQKNELSGAEKKHEIIAPRTRSTGEKTMFENDALRWEEDQINSRLQKKLDSLKRRVPTIKPDFVIKRKTKRQKVLKPFEDSDES